MKVLERWHSHADLMLVEYLTSLEWYAVRYFSRDMFSIPTQFKALKDGDRFFFTHDQNPNPFDDKQLENIKVNQLAYMVAGGDSDQGLKSGIKLLTQK